MNPLASSLRLCCVLVLLMAPSISLAAPPEEHRAQVWMHPSGREKGQPFRDLFEHPEAWAKTRAKIDVLSNTDLHFQHDFTDDELGKDFALLKQWNIRLALETGSIKPWGKTGEQTFNIERPMWERIERLGGEIYAIAMDEPLCCCRQAIHQPDEYAVRETANYIALVRQHFPKMLVGDIEAYPFIPLADQLTWIEALQKRLAEMNVRGLDFYRLDVDWMNFIVRDRGSWPEVRKIEQYCRQHKIPFSLIYWASGFGAYERRGMADDSTWYNLIMAQGYAYAGVDGRPDQIMIESWLDAPRQTIPETDPWSFTRSVLDFVDRFSVHHAIAPATAPAKKAKPGAPATQP